MEREKERKIVFPREIRDMPNRTFQGEVGEVPKGEEEEQEKEECNSKAIMAQLRVCQQLHTQI